jgi:hypothetical protein
MFVQTSHRNCALVVLVFAQTVCFSATPKRIPFSQASMREASRELTAAESSLLKHYIQNNINEVKQGAISDPRGAKAAKLDEMFQELYRSRPDLVLRGVSELGDDPQYILNTSKLRTYMLSGKLEHTPWFLREIAALDWFFEYDSKRSSRNRKWPKPQDKLVYIMSLADELLMNHAKVFDGTLVLDAVDTLEKHINMWPQHVSKSFRPRVDSTLEKLHTLRAQYANEEGR